MINYHNKSLVKKRFFIIFTVILYIKCMALNIYMVELAQWLLILIVN